MRVTVVTTWLPTDRAPSSGSFVLRDSAAEANAEIGTVSEEG